MIEERKEQDKEPKNSGARGDLRLARERDPSIFFLSHRRHSFVFFPLSPPLLAIWSVHILVRSAER